MAYEMHARIYFHLSSMVEEMTYKEDTNWIYFKIDLLELSNLSAIKMPENVK